MLIAAAAGGGSANAPGRTKRSGQSHSRPGRLPGIGAASTRAGRGATGGEEKGGSASAPSGSVCPGRVGGGQACRMEGGAKAQVCKGGERIGCPRLGGGVGEGPAKQR